MCWGNNDNGVGGFCSFHHLAICGTMFEHRIHYKASWVSTDRYRTSNQIAHFAISSRLGSCVPDVLNKKDANIDLERNHNLTVAYVRLCIACAISRKVEELLASKLNIDYLYDPAVAPIHGSDLNFY